MGASLHDNAVVIDGLIIANFTREVFADMRKGGLTAANCTCSVWEDCARFAHGKRSIPQVKCMRMTRLGWASGKASLRAPLMPVVKVSVASLEPGKEFRSDANQSAT